MTKVYTIQFSDDDNINEIMGVYDSLESAQKQVCYLMMDWISCNSYENEAEYKSDIKKINGHVRKSEYQEAIEAFGEWVSYNDLNCYYNYGGNNVDIYANTPMIFDDSLFEDDTSNDADVVASVSGGVYKPTTCGAICRTCNQSNEHAYATHDDGTYECYSCRSMKEIFNK
jgi:hypothetical protein